MTEWVPRMPCRVVEHDEKTGQPLPGGQVYPTTVAAIVGDVVLTEPVQGWIYPRPLGFAKDSRAAYGMTSRWRLLPGTGDDTEGRPPE